jgi:hypothetical protein
VKASAISPRKSTQKLVADGACPHREQMPAKRSPRQPSAEISWRQGTIIAVASLGAQRWPRTGQHLAAGPAALALLTLLSSHHFARDERFGPPIQLSSEFASPHEYFFCSGGGRGTDLIARMREVKAGSRLTLSQLIAHGELRVA